MNLEDTEHSDPPEWLRVAANQLGNKKRDVARALNLPNATIEDIEQDCRGNAQECSYKLLEAWYKNCSIDDKLNAFRRALCKCDLKDLANRLSPRQRMPSGSIKPISNITPNVKDYKDTQDLKRCMEHMEQTKFVALTGLSGSGKTEIAKAYWNRKKDLYDVGWLIPSESDQELRNSLLLFQERLKSFTVDPNQDLPDMLSQVNSEIKRDANRKFLLIFDDVTDSTQYVIQQGFPPSENISVIITTQTSHPYAIKESIQPINGFTEDEVLQFLEELQDRREMKIKLWEEMSHLPSALACAKFDINKLKRDIDHYLKGIKHKQVYRMMERRDRGILGNSYKKTPIEAHVQNVRTMLDELKADGLPKLCMVFKAMAFFDSKAIPVFILEDILRLVDPDADMPVESMIDELLNKMINRSYVTIFLEDGDMKHRLVDTHDLVQLATRFEVQETSDHLKSLEILMRVLLCYFAKDTRYMSYFKINTLLMPHVEMVLEHVHKLDLSFEMKIMEIAMFDILGYSHTQSGSREVAEQKLQTGVDLVYKSLNMEEADVDRDISIKLRRRSTGMQSEMRVDDNQVTDPDEFAHEKALFMYEKLETVCDRVSNKFVANTVLNADDVAQMKQKISKDKKFPKLLSQDRIDRKIYDELVQLGCCVPEEKIKSIYLPELYASVFYTYGRMYFYNKDKYQRNTMNTNMLISAIRLSSALCKVIEEKTGVVVFHSILTKRNALFYLLSENKNEMGKEKSSEEMLRNLYQGQREYENLSKLTDNNDWYQHGILKVTKNDRHHKCVCTEKVVFISTRILKMEKDPTKREEVIKKGLGKIKILQDEVDLQEQGSGPGRTLHRGSDFYVVSAEFYEAAGEKYMQEAHDNYKKATGRFKATNCSQWKKYGKACEGQMRTAKALNMKDVLKKAKEEGDTYNLKAPADAPYKQNISTLTAELEAQMKSLSIDSSELDME
ncbi:unnamed protein product [Owenia fusiformis]|uniref:Death domain-containing protein n=1 Tax=Owenia fusiformis TaxID=6347 RepID=A0A8S4N372_OWEFU|nr:unnamed protein product [Owenia fusiformis]